MSKQFTLGKNERLKSRKDIEQLFSSGQRLNSSLFRVSYIFRNETVADDPVKFGVAVSSRYFKKAVDRNRIKRLVREAWRLQKNELKQQLSEQRRLLHVFFIYTGKALPAFADVSEQVKMLIEKLRSR